MNNIFVSASVPVEPMLPMPPVGFQLVRDPTTGQFLFFPTTTIGMIIIYLITYINVILYCGCN